jgi:hypothetical protein
MPVRPTNWLVPTCLSERVDKSPFTQLHACGRKVVTNSLRLCTRSITGRLTVAAMNAHGEGGRHRLLASYGQ